MTRMGIRSMVAGGLIAVGLGCGAAHGAEGAADAGAPQQAGNLPKKITAQERQEFERFLRENAAMRAAVDELFASKQVRPRLEALATLFDDRRYDKSHYAYSKLIDVYTQADLAPLLAAYDRAEGVEARIWFAAVADYCGNQELLERLAAEVEQKLKGPQRDRAAVAVAFKLDDPRMTPYLIEALGSSDKFWPEGPELGPSAAYLLTELTNHYVGEYPHALANHCCRILPPPIIPYPVPMGGDEDPERAAEAQQKWRAWWRDNKGKSRKEWVLKGLARDMAMVRNGPIPSGEAEALGSRLHRFLEVYPNGAPESRRELERAWEAAQRDYAIPAPFAR